MSFSKRIPSPTVVFAVVLVLFLSACDNNASRSPLELGMEGDAVFVAMCGPDVELERVYASSRNRALGQDWVRFWDATGAATLETGDVLELGQEVEGLRTTLSDDPQIAKGSDIAITIVSVSSGKSLSSTFHVGEEGLREDLWLKVDGTSAPDVCGDLGQ